MSFSRFVSLVTNARPGRRTKVGLEWTAACTGTVLGIWGIIALVSGGGMVSQKQFDEYRASRNEAEGHNYPTFDRNADLDKDSASKGKGSNPSDYRKLTNFFSDSGGPGDVDERLIPLTPKIDRESWAGEDKNVDSFIRSGDWDRAEEALKKSLLRNHRGARPQQCSTLWRFVGYVVPGICNDV